MQIITLKNPFKSPDTGAQITQISLRDPKAGDPKAGDLFAVTKMRDASQEERSLELVRRCITDLSPREVEEIALPDFLEIAGKVNAGAPGFPQRSSAEAT